MWHCYAVFRTDIMESENNQIVLETPIINESVTVKLRKII